MIAMLKGLARRRPYDLARAEPLVLGRTRELLMLLREEEPVDWTPRVRF